MLREPVAQRMLSDVLSALSDRATSRIVRGVFSQPPPTFKKGAIA